MACEADGFDPVIVSHCWGNFTRAPRCTISAHYSVYAEGGHTSG
jgi:hypothetical protein